LEIDAAAWEHLRPTLQDARSHLIPRDELWEAKMTDGQPVVRILIGQRWCELRLNNASWSSKKRAAYESVASDAAGAELFLFRQSADARRQDSSGRQGDAHTIVCRIEALLLRSQVEASQEPQAPPPVRASKLDLTVSQLEKMNVRDLRKAIRANLVSFPSQVPAFQKHERLDLPPSSRMAQLYFVLGWHCCDIAARYQLSECRVRQILNAWKCRAVEAGYIQPIPPADVLGKSP